MLLTESITDTGTLKENLLELLEEATRPLCRDIKELHTCGEAVPLSLQESCRLPPHIHEARCLRPGAGACLLS